jgi:uncharacterized coiled-coil DUF342 family protein
MKMLVKVEGGQFVKNTENRALLTVNPQALQQNEARKKLASKLNSKNDEINNIKQTVATLSEDISDIKNLLTKLLNQKS